jgi:hypothetical protein
VHAFVRFSYPYRHTIIPNKDLEPCHALPCLVRSSDRETVSSGSGRAPNRALLPPGSSLSPGKMPELAATRGPTGPFLLTDQTEVLLDGRPCRYQDVPAGASIVGMDVAADKRTVLKVHFRTKK